MNTPNIFLKLDPETESYIGSVLTKILLNRGTIDIVNTVNPDGSKVSLKVESLDFILIKDGVLYYKASESPQAVVKLKSLELKAFQPYQMVFNSDKGNVILTLSQYKLTTDQMNVVTNLFTRLISLSKNSQQAPLEPTTAATVDAPIKAQAEHGHYYRDVSKYKYIDYYRLCELYQIHDAAIAHSFKKLLAVGKRGVKDQATDIKEIIKTLERKLQMLEEDDMV